MRPKLPTWKIIVYALLIIAAIFINFYFITHAKGEEEVECWIMCQPDSWVYARQSPSKKGTELGRLELGDKVYTDGKVKNGYLHVIDLWFEMQEGWVKKGYVVYDKPYRPVIAETTVRSNGRVAARTTINGKRRRWLKDGQQIKVYMISEEWSVTNQGFVKTKFLNLDN